MSNPYGVSTAYIASVMRVREILKSISTPNDRWWIESEEDESLVIAYDPEPAAKTPGINIITFRFPKVYHLPFPQGDGEMVCLHPVVRWVGKQALYMEGTRLVNDDVQDWQRFWPSFKVGLAKIERMLIEKYSLDGVI